MFKFETSSSKQYAFIIGNQILVHIKLDPLWYWYLQKLQHILSVYHSFFFFNKYNHPTLAPTQLGWPRANVAPLRIQPS